MALKVGFIGAGGIAGAHMPSVAEHKDTKIVAMCDVNGQRAEEAAKKYGSKAYTDYVEMLKSQRLDAAYVCLPPASHGRIELDLARRNIPFCVEKPVNIDPKAGVKVAKAVRRKGLVTSVGYQVRYAPQVQKAADFLKAHPVTLVEGWFVGGMPGTPWWRQRAISGGQALEQTTHIFDLARLLGGEVAEVCAYGAVGAMKDIENYDIEDATIALLKFESGAIGHICSACVLNKGGAPHVGLRFDGRDYTVELTYGSLKISAPQGACDEPYPGVLGPAMKELDNTFLSAVESGDASKIKCDYVGGLRSAAISMAVNESLAKGKPISLAKLLKGL